MSDYIKIGHTLKAHGVNGEIKVFVEEVYEMDFDEAEVLFLKIKGQLIPYFIESIRSPNTPIVKFEDISNREMAKAIASKTIYLKVSDIIPKTTSNLQYEYCKGYILEDIYAGKVGTVKDILEYPQQEMAVVKTIKGQEILIPLNEHFITTIDKERKLIQVALPEGLLNIAF